MPPAPEDEHFRDEVLLSWCLAELAHWIAAPPTPRQFHEGFTDIFERSGSVVLFSFNDDQVRLLVRPDYHDLERPTLYLRFFRHLVRSYGLRIKATVAMQMRDGPADVPGLPVFAFQKPLGDRSLLLPDVDFLANHFYVGGDGADPIPFEAKRCSAVFAGVTSGADQITLAKLEAGGVPRVNAALFFRDKPDVDFRLPAIVQCDPDAAEAIRGMDVGVGHRLSWREQIEHKCLLSMDGNGATCSRVVLSLASNSALLKYHSDSQLFYFRGLRPWIEYVPIREHTDVCSVLAWERAAPGSLEAVARQGRRFAALFLGADPVCRYAATLLRLYASAFEGRRQVEPGPVLARAEPWAQVLAHVRDRGDLWGWPGEAAGEPGSGLHVERVLVRLNGAPPGSAIRLRGLDAEGRASDWTDGLTPCTAPGAPQPLHGLEALPVGPAARHLRCELRATFTDGTSAGPVAEGQPCLSPAGAPLESVTLSLHPRA